MIKKVAGMVVSVLPLGALAAADPPPAWVATSVTDAKDTLVGYVGAAAPTVLILVTSVAAFFFIAKLIRRFSK